MQNKLTLLLCCLVFMSASTSHFKSENKEITKNYVLVSGNGAAQNDFYISSIEITNKQYREFLNDLRAKGETDKLQKAMVDSLGWKNAFSSNEPYTRYYFQHNAYDNYPVVNISKEGASIYCNWLTEKYNANSKVKVRFALPTEEQWTRAAQGGDNSAIYPWKGNSVKYEGKGKYMNNAMCNYRRTPEFGQTNKANNANADVTAPSVSFMPNYFGIYNMSGNVAELLADKNYTKGGSWNSQPDKITIQAKEEFGATNYGPTIGFRPVMINTGAN